jgi:superfamily II DNA or RNA helicase
MSVVGLQKVNELYNKIICDPDVMMELSSHFTFEVPGAKFTPAYRNKVWDGRIRMLNSMTGHIYAGLTRYIEDFCDKRNYEVEYLSNFTSEEYSIKEANEFIKTLGLPLSPRDYQIEALVHAVRERRSLLLSPTASGKSLIIYLLTRYYNEKTLIITPSTSLVHQLYSDFHSYGYESDKNCHRIYSGQDKQTNKLITITTWQSIYKMDKKWFQQFKVVIGDEAHLFKAKSLQSIMSSLYDCKYRFGFTGTLDGLQTNRLILEGLFGAVRKVTTTSELIEQKHLSNFSIKSIILSYPEEVCKLISKMDYQQEIDYIVTSKERNRFLVNLVLSLNGNVLLLYNYVDKHGKVLYNTIKSEAGDRKVYFVHGGVDGEEREKIRGIVEHEPNAIIVASFGTFSTGINIKNLHNIIFASPSKSRIRSLQSIGRVLRKSETKTEATLYDIADNMSYKKKPNFTLIHYTERMKVYAEEQFEYKIYKVELKF